MSTMTSTRVQSETSVDGRSIALKQFISKSVSQFSSHIASEAAIFQYRIRRNYELNQLFTFNIHGLLNLTDCVKQFGPLESSCSILKVLLSYKGLANRI